MHGRRLRSATCLALVGALHGCALVVPRSYVEKEEVTLPAAFKAIACGLATYQNELSALRLNPGTVLDEATVTLALKASATGDSTLVVDGSVGTGMGGLVPLGVTYTDKLSQVGDRSNTIVLKFRNIYTAGLNKPGEAQVARQPIRFGPERSAYRAVDRPCEPLEEPVSVDRLKQLMRERHAQAEDPRRP